MKRKKIDWDDMGDLTPDPELISMGKKSILNKTDYLDISEITEENENVSYNNNDDLPNEEKEPITTSVNPNENILNNPRYFGDHWSVPLIRFSKDCHETLNILNTLLQHAQIITNKQGFAEGHYKEEIQKYILKINEGLRYVKTLKSDQYCLSEINFIDQEIKTIAEQSRKKKSFWG